MHISDQVARIIGNIINPEIVVLGGGMSNEESRSPMINKPSFHKKLKTQMVQARNGDSSGVIGAVLLSVFREILKQTLGRTR